MIFNEERHIFDLHLPVPDVIGIDNHHDPLLTTSEAARPRGLHVGHQVVVVELAFHRIEDGLTAPLLAGSAGITRGPIVGTDENVSLWFCHRYFWKRPVVDFEGCLNLVRPVLKQGLGQDEFLNFGCTFVDPQGADLTVDPLDGRTPFDAKAAVVLHGAIDDISGGLGCK